MVAHFPSGSAAPGNVITAAQTAVSRWNNEVLGLAGYADSLPHFNPTVIGGTSAPGTIVDLLYTDECTSQDCGYCGNWFQSGGIRGIDLKRRNLGNPCGGLGRVVDDLSGVIMHELSHVMGFSHTSIPESEWCVTNVQEEGDLNPHLCRWEIQSVYAAYDLRNSDPAPEDTIASRIVIIPNPDTVLTGSSDTIRAVGLVDPEPSQNVAGGGGPGLPSVVGPPDTISINVNWDDLESPFFAATKILTSPQGRARIDGVQVGQGPVVATAVDQINAVFPWPVDTATIVVESASGLNPCFDEEHTQTWRNTDQYLTTGCGSTGANIQYRWRFQDGGSWTSFSPDTIHEFQGHSTADTHTVTMEVKNTSTGATEQSSRQFTVLNSLMSMSGPTYVTDKQLKTYTSNWAGRWFERYDPETSYTWNLTLTPPDTIYTRVWAAGEYTNRLRVERFSGGYVGRDWLEIEVCHESIPGCGVQFLVMPGQGEQDGLPLFGGGPWIAVGDEMVRFYDLTGAHERDTPFADASWLDATGLNRAISADGRTSLAWEVVAAAPDARVVEFVVDGVAGPYTFGLALDPDLGSSPADDRSAYDPESGILMAFDGAEAVGFALRSGAGNSIAGVKQYGARRFAPRDSEKLLQTSRQTGVDLTTEGDDVQFLVSTPESTGMERWTLLMARGDDQQAVLTRLKELIGN